METKLEVIGYKGDRVTLAGENTGVDGMWLESDITGFFDPQVSTVTKSFARRPGQRFFSSRVKERTLVFRVGIANDPGSGNSWKDRDARWRRLWSFNDYSRILVTTGDGTRTLRARLEEIEVDTTYDPNVNEATTVVMTVVADDPFWYGVEYSNTVTVANGSSASITVPVANPTENWVFPVWALEAPGTWTVPDYDADLKQFRNVNMPAITSGQDLVVNQDPATRQVEAQDGSLVWAKMNGVRFKGGIPPRTGSLTFPISLSGSSPRQAMLVLARPFSRPWGEV